MYDSILAITKKLQISCIDSFNDGKFIIMRNNKPGN